MRVYADCHIADPVLIATAKEFDIPLPERIDLLQSGPYLAQFHGLATMTRNGTQPPERFSLITVLMDSVYGWLMKDQERFLFEKVKALPDGAVIIELGACRGKSTVAMAFGCVGSGKRIYSIDTFSGNDGLMGKGEDFQPVRAGNLRRFGLEKYAIPLRGLRSDIIPQRHLYPPPDFVFIDAAHEYVGVLVDFKNIYPYVKEGGFISFHDVEIGWPGSWRVWKDYGLDLLTHHEYSFTLACGRKEPGRPFRRRPGTHPVFDYAREACLEVGGLFGPQHALTAALCMSYEGLDWGGHGRKRILAAEDRIMNAPETDFHDWIRESINSKDGRIDGYLRLWHGLSLLKQERFEEALEQFMAVTLVSRPVPEERVEPYMTLARSRLNGEAPVVLPIPEGSKEFHAFVKTSDTVIAVGRDASSLLRGLRCAGKVILDADARVCAKPIYDNGIDALQTWDDIPPESCQAFLCQGGLETDTAPLQLLRSGFASPAKGGIAVFLIPSAEGAFYSWSETTLRNLFSAAGFRVESLTAAAAGGMRIIAKKP